MKYFVVIDTNVLVSAALKPESNPGLIFKFVDENIIVPLINEEIINEYRQVLSREKFQFNNELIDSVLETITRHAIRIDNEHIMIDLPDEKDRIFYEVVMESNKFRESRLVTGNLKHFPLETYILSPKELCEIILNNLLKK